jgi:hypothetical protein
MSVYRLVLLVHGLFLILALIRTCMHNQFTLPATLASIIIFYSYSPSCSDWSIHVKPLDYLSYCQWWVQMLNLKLACLRYTRWAHKQFLYCLLPISILLPLPYTVESGSNLNIPIAPTLRACSPQHCYHKKSMN